MALVSIEVEGDAWTVVTVVVVSGAAGWAVPVLSPQAARLKASSKPTTNPANLKLIFEALLYTGAVLLSRCEFIILIDTDYQI
jgi:hypothetical protein